MTLHATYNIKCTCQITSTCRHVWQGTPSSNLKPCETTLAATTGLEDSHCENIQDPATVSGARTKVALGGSHFSVIVSCRARNWNSAGMRIRPPCSPEPNSHDLRPLASRQPPSRMVAAINICICDRDGRRPSSTPAHFEAPDALGSGERGGRILMPAEFQFRALSACLRFYGIILVVARRSCGSLRRFPCGLPRGTPETASYIYASRREESEIIHRQPTAKR